ncbi:MAG: amino acid-binding protein [Gemmataceae bacterium]
METTKQTNVFLENKPGRLAQVLSALEKDKVSITGLTVMDSHEQSVLRMVTSDPARTALVLKGLSCPFTETDVLLVELRHQIGALAHVCEQLAAEHVNIDYCYVSAGSKNGRTYGVFKVSNTAKAQKAITSSNSKGYRKVGRRPLHTR